MPDEKSIAKFILDNLSLKTECTRLYLIKHLAFWAEVKLYIDYMEVFFVINPSVTVEKFLVIKYVYFDYLIKVWVIS